MSLGGSDLLDLGDEKPHLLIFSISCW